MRRPASRCLNDQGLEESVSVILVVILVIALAAIIASIVFGLAIFYPKSAYIAVQTEAKNASSDNWYLSVFHMNGDAAYLNHTLATNEGMPVDFQFTNATLGTVIPKPDPADGPETWKPGDTLFVYNKCQGPASGLRKMRHLPGNGTGLPIGVWRFDVVDKTDDVLIYTKNVGVGVPEPTDQYTLIAIERQSVHLLQVYFTVGPLTPAGGTATYQWQSGPSGGPYTNIPGATGTTCPLVAGDLQRYRAAAPEPSVTQALSQVQRRTGTPSTPHFLSISNVVAGKQRHNSYRHTINGDRFPQPLPVPTVIFIKGSNTMTATVTAVTSE